MNYFQSLMRGDALQTYKNIKSPYRERLEEVLTVLRGNYVKPQSMATLKRKLKRVIFFRANQMVRIFLMNS